MSLPLTILAIGDCYSTSWFPLNEGPWYFAVVLASYQIDVMNSIQLTE